MVENFGQTAGIALPIPAFIVHLGMHIAVRSVSINVVE